MGHSDRIVIADGNFPAESMGKNAKVIRMDGHGIPEILDAILQLFPLDTYVEKPFNLMEVMPGDDVETPIWDVPMKRSRQNMSPGERLPSDRLNDLLFMRKRKRPMPSLQQGRRRFTPISCCRKVW